MNEPTTALTQIAKTLHDQFTQHLESSNLDIPAPVANEPLKHIDHIHKMVTIWVFEQKRSGETRQDDFDHAGYLALINLNLFANALRLTPTSLPVSRVIQLQSITHQAVKQLAKILPSTRKDFVDENQPQLPF